MLEDWKSKQKKGGLAVEYQKKIGRFPSRSSGQIVTYYIYMPAVDRPQGILQIAHGMCEYLERYEPFIEFMVEQGWIVCGNDHLGHGRTAADESGYGYMGGKDGWRNMVKDMHTLTRRMQQLHAGLLAYDDIADIGSEIICLPGRKIEQIVPEYDVCQIDTAVIIAAHAEVRLCPRTVSNGEVQPYRIFLQRPDLYVQPVGDVPVHTACGTAQAVQFHIRQVVHHQGTGQPDHRRGIICIAQRPLRLGGRILAVEYYVAHRPPPLVVKDRYGVYQDLVRQVAVLRV